MSQRQTAVDCWNPAAQILSAYVHPNVHSNAYAIELASLQSRHKLCTRPHGKWMRMQQTMDGTMHVLLLPLLTGAQVGGLMQTYTMYTLTQLFDTINIGCKSCQPRDPIASACSLHSQCTIIPESAHAYLIGHQAVEELLWFAQSRQAAHQ